MTNILFKFLKTIDSKTQDAESIMQFCHSRNKKVNLFKLEG